MSLILRILFVLGICIGVFNCSNDVSSIPDDPFYQADGNNDGVPDSVAKYAPACSTALNICVEIAKHHRDSIVAYNGFLDSNKIISSMSDFVVYDSNITIKLSVESGKGKIYYSFNDSTIDTTNRLYTGSILLSGSQTIYAAVWINNQLASHISKWTYTIISNEKLSLPIITPKKGVYTKEQTVHITHDNANVELRYTLDGQIPIQTSSLYADSLLIDKNTRLQVKAFHKQNSFQPSDIADEEYRFQVATPISLLDTSKTYDTAQMIKLSTSTPKTVMYYSDNSQDPQEATSMQYRDGISITSATTIKVRAFRSGWDPSAIATLSYNIVKIGVTSTPKITPFGGTFTNDTTISMESEPNAKIFYRLDSLAPDTIDTEYKIPFLIKGSSALTARAFLSGKQPSDLTRSNIVFNVSSPVISSNVQSSNNPITVTISSETKNAKIFYTTKSKDPDSTDSLYTSAITIKASAKVRAIAYKNGYTTSGITEKQFTITEQGKCNPPTITPADSIYTGSVKVKMQSTTDCPDIYYTSDESIPTITNSKLYTTELAFDYNVTIKAIAVGADKKTSDVAQANYQVQLNAPTSSLDLSQSYSKGTWISFKTSDQGAIVRYAIGTDAFVTSFSTQWKDSLKLDSVTVFKVQAYRAGNLPSEVKKFTVLIKANKPIASLPSQTIHVPTWLSLSAEAGDTIYYDSIRTMPNASNKTYKTRILLLNDKDPKSRANITLSARAFHRPRLEGSDTLQLDYFYDPHYVEIQPVILTEMSPPRPLTILGGLPDSLSKIPHDVYFDHDSTIVKYSNGLVVPVSSGTEMGYVFSKDQQYWGSFVVVVVKDQPIYQSSVQNWDILIKTDTSGETIQKNQVGFPIAVTLNNSLANSRKAPLVFTKLDGTVLDWDLDNYDATTHTSTIWVRLDTLKAKNGLQMIKAYYFDVASPLPTPTVPIFASEIDGYRGVYHFENLTPVTGMGGAATMWLADHASVAHNLKGVNITQFNQQTAVSLIGKSLSINRTAVNQVLGSYPTSGTPVSISGNFSIGLTVSTWFNTEAVQPNGMGYVFISGAEPNTSAFGCALNNEKFLECWTFGRNIKSATSVSDGKWHHIVLAINGSVIQLYVDGVLHEEAVSAPNSFSQPFFVGGVDFYSGNDKFGPTYRPFRGKIDEVQVIDAYRSADWAAAEYATQKQGQKIIRVYGN